MRGKRGMRRDEMGKRASKVKGNGKGDGMREKRRGRGREGIRSEWCGGGVGDLVE